MKTKILTLLAVSTIAFTGVQAATVKFDVNNLQASQASNEVGAFGNIIATIFNSAGKITGDYLDLDTSVLLDGDNNAVSSSLAVKTYVDNVAVGLQTYVDNNSSVWDEVGTKINYMGGNVGIGTTDPTSKLHIAKVGTTVDEDALKVGVDGETSGSIKFYDDDAESSQNFKLSFNAGTQDLRFHSDQLDNILYLTETGNVGIGTPTPAKRLEVSGGAYSSSTNEHIRTSITYGGNVHSSGIGVAGGGSYWGTNIFQDGNKVLTIDSNRALLVGAYVDTAGPTDGIAVSGNVGIGTPSPNAKLHIEGGDINLGASADPSTNQGDDAITWGLRSDGQDYYNIKTDYHSYDPAGSIGSSTYSRLQLNWHTGVEIGAHGNYGGTRFFDNSPGVNGSLIAGIGDGGQTYFTQSVGIGTKTPGTKLDVAGTGRFSGTVIAATPTETNHLTTKAYVDSAASNANTVGGINPSSFLRADQDDLLYEKIIVGSTNNRRAGMYGSYNSTRVGHIWSMGSAYQIPENGANFGNLYGLAYKHTNNTTGGTMAGGHQAVWTQNGNGTAAIGTDIWTSGAYKVDGTTVIGNDAWIEGDRIRQNTIDGGEIQNDSLTASDLAANSVGNSELVDNIDLTTLNLRGSNKYPLYVSNTTNGGRVGVQFSDQNSQLQKGHIEFAHSDSVSHGAGASFHVGSTESKTNLVVDGNVVSDEPTAGNHVTTKSYVDNFVNGLTWKAPVESNAATTYGTCTAAKESWTTYNKADNIIYVCNGSAWVQMGSTVGLPNLAGEVTGPITSNVVANNTIDSANVKDNTLTASDLAANSVGNSELIDNPTVNTIYAPNWFRSTGASGWYNQTYAGGIYMADTSWIRTYGGKNFYSDRMIRADDGFQVDAIQVIGSDAWVEGDRIRQNTIDGGEIQDNSLTASDLAADSVGSSELANNSVASANVIDNSLTANDLAANSVGASELLNTGNFTMNDLTVNGQIYANSPKRTRYGGVDTYENVAQYYAGNSTTGTYVIKIGNTPNMMIDAEISLQGYGNVKKFHVRGYTYTSQPVWHDVEASCFGSGRDTCTVRFAKEVSTGDKVILLGTTTTNWGSYPHVAVTKVTRGYPGSGGIGNWSISKVTSEAGYSGITSANVNDGFTAYNPNFTGNVKVNGTTVINSSAYVLGDRIEQNSIDGSEIQNDSLTASDLAADSVGASELANNSVASANVIDNSLTASDLAANSVGNSELVNTANLTINNIYRAGHNKGHLVGSYNSVGENSTKSNPIYSIGSSYMPADSTLGNFYGIGYTHGNASFAPSGMGWGAYVAADGDARHFLDGSSGTYWNSGGIKVDSRTVVGTDGWTEGDNIRQNTIDGSEVQNDSLTASDLAADSVGASELANNSVASANVIDNSLTASDLAPNSVGSSELIASPAFTNPTVATPTSGSHAVNKTYVDNLVNGIVWKTPSATSASATHGTCTAAKEGWTTFNKSNNIIYVCNGSAWVQMSSTVGLPNLAGEVTGPITSNVVANNTIDSANVIDNSLTASDLAADSVGASELANNSVASANVIDNSLTASDLAANSVGTSEVANNSLTASDLAANSVGDSEMIDNPRFTSLRFNGEGGNSGNGVINYGIYQEGGSWSHPYPDLVVGYHTGVKIGGHYSYNGTRFYNDAPGRAGALELMSVGNGNNDVKVKYNLRVDGNLSLGGTLGGDSITDNTIDSSEIQNDTITESDISDSYVARAAAKVNYSGHYTWMGDMNATPRSMYNKGLSVGFVGSSQNNAPISYGSLMNIPSYTSGQDGGAGQILFPYDQGYTGNGNPMFRVGDYSNAGWKAWKTFLDKDWGDSLYVNVGEGINGDTIIDNTIDSSEIQNNTLTASDLAADSVGASELANNSVASANVIDNSLTASDLAADSVGASELANNSVASANVIDNSLTASDLAANSVGTSEVANDSLTASDLAANSVGNSELIDNPTVTYLNMTAGNGYGVRFWGSDSYKIAMGNAADYKYGPVTDYSIKTNMSNTAGRGWTWGVTGLAPKTALGIQGNFQTAGVIRAENGFQVDGTQVIGGDAWVEGDRIRQGTIDATEIEDNTVGTNDILNNTITETDISDSFIARNANLLDGVNSTSFLRADLDDLLYEKIIAGDTNKRRAGMYGIYDYTKVGHVWSMGSAYQIPENGANFGNLYGLAYKYASYGGGGDTAGGHQVIWAQNGTPTAGLGTNIWTSGAYKVDNTTVIGSDAWIEGDRIRQNTIDGSEIENDSLTASDLAANSVGNSELHNAASFTMANLTTTGNTNTSLLTFKGVGGSSGQAANAYGIYQESGAWSYPYPDLMMRYHTGIKLSAHSSYGGIKMYSRSGENLSLTVDDNVKVEGNLMRSAHERGGLVGGYNNVGENSSRTSPIYSIGTNYLPASTTLGDHYGMGYTHAGNASFIPVSGGWGTYVSADGDARIFLDASYGRIYASSAVKTLCIGNCY